MVTKIIILLPSYYLYPVVLNVAFVRQHVTGVELSHDELFMNSDHSD